MKLGTPMGRFHSDESLAQATSSVQVADMAVTTWSRIDAALAPIIGHGGVDALFKRSLHLVCGTYPWLESAYAGALQPGDLGLLGAALQAQSLEDAAAAHRSVLSVFHDLLANLIGIALTERLLRSVWDPSFNGDAVQDNMP